MLSKTLTLPKNCAVCIENKLNDLGCQKGYFAHTRLSVGADAFNAWLDGSLPISVYHLCQICIHLKLDVDLLLDALPETYQGILSKNIFLLKLKDLIEEEGLAAVMLKYEQQLNAIIHNMHFSPVPVEPFVLLEQETEEFSAVRIIPDQLENFSCKLCVQYLDVVCLNHTRITIVNDQAIVESLLDDKQSLMKPFSEYINLGVYQPKGGRYFITSDYKFDIEILNAVNEVIPDIIAISPSNSFF